MVTTQALAADDLLWPQFDPDDCVLSEDGCLGEISAADRWTRGQAIGRYAREVGIRFTDVRCRVEWIRPLTRQDGWDDRGADEVAWAWADEHNLKWRGGAWRDPAGVEHVCPVPDRVPDEWDAGEPWGVWTVCKKGEPGAVKVYICEDRTL